MTNCKNLKQTILAAAEHYERHATHMQHRMERATEGSNIQRELRDSYEYNKGRAKAMREVFEYLEEFIG
jgi:hypothetical protein